ncbi:MAG: dihydrofolate reductase [Bacteroidales bacterium]|nr:dihydrofolate reductase [Bacteroidales bacterium]
MISIIAAVSDDLGIGKDNDLLWHLSDDLKRFKKLTTGQTVIMGKRTWESLPVRPLPNRKNVVITDVAAEIFPGAVTAYSIEDALEKCREDKEIFIMGGGSIYRQFMPLAGRLIITHVHSAAEADVWFPRIDMRKWKVAEKEEHSSEAIPYTYVVYHRKK